MSHIVGNQGNLTTQVTFGYQIQDTQSKPNNDGTFPNSDNSSYQVTLVTSLNDPTNLSANAVTDPTAKQTAYRNDLRRIWRDKNISDLQTTLDALEQVKIEDDVIWRDMVKYLAKVGDNGSKLKRAAKFCLLHLAWQLARKQWPAPQQHSR